MTQSVYNKIKVEYPKSIRELLNSSLDSIDAAYHGKNTHIGVPTGFTDLDNITSGVHRGDLILIGGRPSMGKSTFLYNILVNIARNSEGLVVLFSMGISSELITKKMLASLANVDVNSLIEGNLRPDEWHRLSEAVSELAMAKLFIDDTPRLSADDIRSKLQGLVNEKGEGIEVVAIDCIASLIDKSRGRLTPSEACLSLKPLAEEFNTPFIVTSQLNRNLEHRVNKRPLLSDLYGGDDMEGHVDLVLFLYRDEVYDIDSKEKDIVELIVGKNRNGPVCMVKLKFSGRYARFDGL